MPILFLTGCRGGQQSNVGGIVTRGAIASPVANASETKISAVLASHALRDGTSTQSLAQQEGDILAVESFTDAPVLDLDSSTRASVQPGFLASVQYMDLSLPDAIALALSNIEILRSLNARVVSSPDAVPSSLDPSIQYNNPVVGYQAALSAFDARATADGLFSKNDDVFNNPVLGSGANEIRDDVTEVQAGLDRVNRYGTQFSLRSSIQNSDSNNPSLRFPSSWTTLLEGSIRQPLMQGRGQVNEILGPNALPGNPNNRGIFLACTDVKISKIEFQQSVREMVRDIVESYWELSLASRRLEASVEVQKLAFDTWQATKARFDQDLQGGAADEEALARAQYFRISAQVNEDLNGDRADGQLGLMQAESNLRRLIGLRETPSELIRPIDEPYTAPTQFAWESLAAHASVDRLEIQRQQSRINQIRLELTGLRNLLMPRLDVIVTMRNNGFGDDLTGDGPRFSSAFQDAFTGDHNESEFGLSYEIPVGVRQAKAAVSNARLRLSRELAILGEQQEQILYELNRSLRAFYRHQDDLRYQTDRLDAAQAAFDARLAAFETGVVTIDGLLIAQQQLLDAKRSYYNTVLAIQRSRLRVNFESGKLLTDQQVAVEQPRSI